MLTHGETPLPSLSVVLLRIAAARVYSVYRVFESRGNSPLRSDKYNWREFSKRTAANRPEFRHVASRRDTTSCTVFTVSWVPMEIRLRAPPITQLLEWPTFRTRGVRFTIVFTRLKKLASRRYDASRACLAATEHRGTIVLGRQLRRNRFNVALFNDPENRDGNAVPCRRFYRPRCAVISIAR